MLVSFEQIIEWRREQYIPDVEVKFQWSDLHLSIVRDYFSNLSTTCDFPELPSEELLDDYFWNARIAASFAQNLEELFKVPRLNEVHENPNRIKKYQLLQVFLSFLLRLLYHKPGSIIFICGDRIEKELRFLLTILGDKSLMLCDDEHEQVDILLQEFEAVANKAGNFVHFLLFSTEAGDFVPSLFSFDQEDDVLSFPSDGAFEKNQMDEDFNVLSFPFDGAFEENKMHSDFDVLSKDIDHLKATIVKFLNDLPLISRLAYTMPNTSVVDSLLIIDSLIDDLEDLMKREDNLIADVKDHVKILHQGLIYFQSSIKETGVSQPSEIGELKEALMRIGDMAHEAEYLIISFLVGDAPLWYLIPRLIDINKKIELIGIELCKITNKYKVAGLRKVPKYFAAQKLLQAKRNSVVENITVGFEDEVTTILDKLLGGTERLQVMVVYGMPGLGKTTFAKKLYNHSSVNNWFDKLPWCVVSQTYQRQSILNDILIQLISESGKDSMLRMDEESSAEHIYRALKGRRYLIVMDDIWDLRVWDDLRRYFPDDGNGSRILLTSRNKDVAPPNSTIHKLPFLSNDQCWELLEKKVFGSRPCPPELQGIGMKIAANCCGLPLAVVVIAGILSTMDKKESTWEEVEGNVASYIFDGGDNLVMQILELSYKHLPEYLKPCFLYLGSFTEDEEICVRELMWLWIAEGFIRKQEEKSLENVAEEHLMELIDKSLVIVLQRRSDGGVKTCILHDLLHDFCLKKSEGENFLKLLKSHYYTVYEKGHRLQAQGDSVSLSYCQHVRSFRGGNQISSFYVRDMRLLRVLHFDYIRTHYLGIEFLINLRYLVVIELPPSIGSLLNLEYLRLETHKTVHLPPAIVKMRKLRYLDMCFRGIYDKDCSSSQATNLEYLSYLGIREPKDEEMLKKYSPHLRTLKCRYVVRPMKKRAYPHFDLSFLTQLDSLYLKFDHYPRLGTLEEFTFPSNIRKLMLIWPILSWEKMSLIGRLENLEVLKLEFNAFVGERWDTRDGEFQKLRYLKIWEGGDLIEWNVASREHFPNLQQLILYNCENLLEIPFEIGEIAALQLISVQGRCQKSLVESAERIQQEQWDLGNQELRVIISIDI